MPKPKPDNIIRHEIVLGRSERELLDTLVTANAATKVVIQPLVALLSDPQALIAIFAILEGLGITDFIPANILELFKEGAYESFEDFEEAAVNALEGQAESLTRLVRYMPIYRSYYYIKKAQAAI